MEEEEEAVWLRLSGCLSVGLEGCISCVCLLCLCPSVCSGRSGMRMRGGGWVGVDEMVGGRE